MPTRATTHHNQFTPAGSVSSCVVALATGSAGCFTRATTMSKRVEVKAGDRYGSLTVLVEAAPDVHHGKSFRRIECQCDCGKRTNVRLNNLRSGQIVSCGCVRRKYHDGQYKSLAYRSWDMMKQRCTNPSDPAYHNYGGRGISVCGRWMDFEPFLEDMGERPSPEHSIDRIDTNGNYEPGNCRWATRKEQNRNRRDNVLLTLGDETLCISEWSDRTGIDACSIRGRIRLGWSVEDALAVVPGTRNKAYLYITWDGRSQTVAAWARERGLKRLTLSKRLQSGWTISDALTTPVGSTRSKP